MSKFESSIPELTSGITEIAAGSLEHNDTNSV